MSLHEIILPAYITVLIGIVGWLLKSDTTKINRRLDCITETQHACQLDNAKTFVTKNEFCELEKTVIDHDRRIITMESRGHQ